MFDILTSATYLNQADTETASACSALSKPNLFAQAPLQLPHARNLKLCPNDVNIEVTQFGLSLFYLQVLFWAKL